MMFAIPMLAVLGMALAASFLVARVHNRAAPGTPVAAVSAALLDRRLHRAVALGALVVAVTAIALD
jgi:hypothetical protein